MLKKMFLGFLVLLLNGLCTSAFSEKIESTGQIPIISWYGPPQSETSIMRYTEMRDTGITYNLSFLPDVESVSKALDVAEKTGIKILLGCPELKSDTEKTVKRFMNHPALGGYYLRDEPNRNDFPELGAWAKKIIAVDSKHFCYLNLFPNYANEEQLGTKTYREHVDIFIKEVPIQLLSFDHYPIIGDDIRSVWYENLEIFSAAARKAGKPFWAFALAVSHGPYPLPTLAELRLQVYSDLAYGAQGIQYFTYWTPSDQSYNFANAPITIDGKRSIVYDRVKEMNKEISALSGVFLGSKVVTVAHTGWEIPIGTKYYDTPVLPVKTLKTEGKGALISQLEKGNRNFLVIVNRDFKKEMKLNLECESYVKRVMKDATVVPLNVYDSKITVDPGDAVILTWEKK